jgi:hypothetical protein
MQTAAWFIARDCCCLFNPCYWFPEEEVTASARVDTGEEHTMTSLLYQLPPDWDPLHQYMQAFDRLDAQFEAAVIDSSAPSSKQEPRVSEYRIQQALELLSMAHPGTLSSSELNRAFNLLRLAIRQTTSVERERLIRRYEAQRAVHSQHDRVELQQAEWWMDLARSQREEPQQRVYYYQKSLYYTHRVSEKRALWDEYEYYCSTLKQHRRDTARAGGKSV